MKDINFFKETISTFQYLLWAINLIWQSAHRWTIAWLTLIILQGLLPIVNIYLTRDLVNHLVPVSKNNFNNDSLQSILIIVIALGIILILSQAVQGLIDWVRTSQSDLVQDYINDLIHQKASEIDLSFYDDPNYYDCLERARVDAISRPVNLLENLSNLLQSSITLVAMSGILIPFGIWVPLALLVSTLPALYITFYYNYRRHQWQMTVTTRQRRSRYYENILTKRENVTETRIFNLSSHFREVYQNLRQRLRNEQLQLIRHQAFADLAAGTLSITVTGIVMAIMVWRALQAQISLGDLTLLYQAFNQGQSLIKNLLSNTGKIYFNSLFIENLKEFLNLAPILKETANSYPIPIPIKNSIQFKNIRFRYPHSPRWALDGFDLTIKVGQVVAIVGTNGAGKSTLMKLLCRFYDPTEGNIFIDNHNLKDLQIESLQKIITVLFQEPVRYNEPAVDNIAYGDWDNHPSFSRIEEAAQVSGADKVIARLPQGYQEVLGKWLGTADLSVGEWQKIALARAFLRQSEIVLLDEPTSAMDSWAEAEWMSRFRELVAGRTAIMITHRFTTAMQADQIYVMDCGKIVESGTHQQLLSLGGLYAQSWKQQMKDVNL